MADAEPVAISNRTPLPDGRSSVLQMQGVAPDAGDLESLILLLSLNPRTSCKMYGKVVQRPRHEAVFGKKGIGWEGYAYGKPPVLIKAEKTMHPLVQRVLDHANSHLRKDGEGEFTWALANLYFKGSDYVSWHADDEADVGGDSVPTYSFGCERRFLVRKKASTSSSGKRGRDDVFEFSAKHGSCIVMQGCDFQKDWEHCVPKTAKPCGPRLSITPRK